MPEAALHNPEDSSPDDVIESLRGYADVRFETTNSDLEIVPLSRSLASASMSFRTTLTIPASEDYTFAGVITWLVEKSPETGAWRVVQGHTSTPGGPPGSRSR